MIKRVSVCLATLTCLCMSFVSSGGANGQVYPLKVDITLANDEITPGEPIILNYAFATVGKTAVVPDLQNDRLNWLKFDVVKGDGTKAPALADHRPLPSPYGGFKTIEGVSPNRKLTGKIVLSQWVRITNPGKYRIKMKIRVPYETTDCPAGANPEDLAFSEDRELVLNVGQGSIRRLDKMAQEWLKKAWLKDPKRTTFADVGVAVQALFSMPEDKVLPYWKYMVANLDEYPYADIKSQLLRLDTPGTRALLPVVAAKERRVLAPQIQESVRRGELPADYGADPSP